MLEPINSHPKCENCQCYPEGRNDCPKHMKCREWLRTGEKQDDSLESRVRRIEVTVGGINRMMEQFTTDLIYEKNRKAESRPWWKRLWGEP